MKSSSWNNADTLCEVVEYRVAMMTNNMVTCKHAVTRLPPIAIVYMMTTKSADVKACRMRLEIS